MSKVTSGKLRKLVTLMLVAIGVFILLNKFVFEPRKQKAESERLKQEAAEQQEEGGDKKVPIKVMDVVRHDFVDVLDALGSIKGGMEFKLTFPIPGTIKAVNYKEGEKYEKGAMLMSLDEEDIILRMKRVEAQMNKTQTAVDIAQQKVEEHEKLFKMGAIPKTTMDRVRLELESASYDLEAAKLELQANESVLEKSNMYAVSDGMIGELYVEEGETITANTLIGTHILTEFVKAEFGVIERDMGKIKTGLEANIFVDAYPNEIFKGIVESIAPVVGGVSRTATVSVKIDNQDGRLLPGMFARINVDLYKQKDALVVPTEAILNEAEDKSYVFVLNPENNTVKKVEVKVAYTRTDYSHVESGVDVGQTIAITSIANLKDETKVEIIEKQTLEFE
ncbi:MAG: efflux RND transporter periplasmic adaptor subunit [Candidatus Omnitrophica bacterium]|nr:efflux RND transporter periplasmic adaptor subunit [Candidatus Omnitrophota bacterium]